ncbi:hypothetical protein GCM10028784_36320 [Myceligenerans cantabricum]
MSNSASNAPQDPPARDDLAGELLGDGVELHDVVDPAQVRRAPRYGRFLGAGVIVGLVIGLAVGYYVVQTPEAEAMLKPGVYVVVITAFMVTFTTIAAGLLAVLADRRSLRKYDHVRRTSR